MTVSIDVTEFADVALGPDLAALVAQQASPLARCFDVTTLRSPIRQRRAYRLEFCDGTCLKGRRLKTAEHAARVERVRRRIGDGYARILQRRGDALLLEWVEGRPLDSLGPLSAELLHRCGRMLGSLHLLEVGEDDASPRPDGQTLLKDLESRIEHLCRAEVIGETIGRRVLEVAIGNRPQTIAYGIVHLDFCSDNLVLGPQNALVSIDNAKLDLGPLDLDLATTWYRWPMTREDRAHFVRGYTEQRSIESLLEAFRFWACYVLVRSTSKRVRSQVQTAVDVPLGRLRNLVALIDRDSDADRLAHKEHLFWRS